jgi:hypothetical protein
MPVILQFTALLCAAFLLYKLWKRVDEAASDDLARRIIAAGFLLRASFGVVIFWISYLGLPFARPLQLGDGFWFFALDGQAYFAIAAAAARRGLSAIIFLDRTSPSVLFLQVLAAFEYAFGTVAAVALILNLLCFLAAVFLIVLWHRADETRSRSAALVPLAAISLSPSVILWSLQPLKDSLFILLIVAFAAAAAAWQRRWRLKTEPRASHLLAIGAIICLLLYALAGIRWYFAFAAWCALFILAAPLVFAVSGRRRTICLIATCALIVSLSQAFRLGAGPYMPESLGKALSLRMRGSTIVATPKHLLAEIETTREGFERTGGATSILLGDRLSSEYPPEQASDLSRVEMPQLPKHVTHPPALVGRTDQSRAAHAAATAQAANIASKSKQGIAAAPPVVAQKSKSKAPATSMTQPTFPARVEVPSGVIPNASGQIPPKPSVPQVEHPENADSASVRLLSSRIVRVAVGFAAIVLPRSVTQPLGIVEMQGGRGLWWFADLDTLCFDAVLVVAIAIALRKTRKSDFKAPIFWGIAALSFLVAVPLIYTVTNFGTLFRLRSMIFVLVALIPLTFGRPRDAAPPNENLVSS